MRKLGPAYSVADHLEHDRAVLDPFEARIVREVDAVIRGDDVEAVFTRVVPVSPFLPEGAWAACVSALSWRFGWRLSLRKLNRAVKEARLLASNGGK